MPLRPPSLPLESHLIPHHQVEHIVSLLAKRPVTPSHVLLFGPPGTGKTSFARAVAKRIHAPAYEIIPGDANNPNKRRTAVEACLNRTNQGEGSIIVIDEADTLLNTRTAWFERGETQDKGWLNHLLEKPGVRIIWIANSLHGLEDSVRRRFAYSVAFREFSLTQRIQIWESVLRANRVEKNSLKKEEIARLAARYTCTAGPVDLAVKKALEVASPKTPAFREAIRMALDAHYALAHEGELPQEADAIEESYTVEGLNLTADIPTLLGNLQAFELLLQRGNNTLPRNLNLLFYGAPGTGKSELARFLANKLHRELHCRQAQDLMGSYVGETEGKVRDAFLLAERSGAVLIIDEADTFLFPRNQAQRSWEISFTNAFLTAMERFRGVLICTTNRLNGLDEASLGRFQYKVGFDWLTPAGAVIFYHRLLAPLTKQFLDPSSEETLRNLTSLAPGDFRTVRDRFLFRPPETLTPAELVAALAEEMRVKEFHAGTEKRIGF